MAKDILHHLKWRYATKKFDPFKILSDEKLAVLKEAFNLTASSYGLQPLKMVVIKNREIKLQLLAHTNNQQQVTDASHVLVLCTETEVDPNYIKNHFKLVERTRATAREILGPFEDFLVNSFSGKGKEEIEKWKTNQAYLAMGNLLTVCAFEEIDSCPIEGFEPEKYDVILKLEEKGLRSVLVLAVGHRDETDFFMTLKKVRRGVEEVVIEM